MVPTPARAQPSAPSAPLPLSFAAPARGAALSLGPEVLTPQERAFAGSLPELRVAIPMPDVRPYEVVGADGTVSGIHPQMLGYLARAFGLRVRPVPMAGFADALASMRDGRADLMMTLGYTAARAQYLEYTLGVTPLPGAVFTRIGQPAPDTPGAPDMAKARFAVEREFLAADYLRRQFPQATLLTVETTGDALRAVHEGRADYYVGALLTTMDWLGREPVLRLQVSRLINYSSGYYHFAVRKDLAPLAGILNKGITTLRADVRADLERSESWRAAMASMPAGMPRPAPLQLRPDDLRLLQRSPVWRVGAVRGLPLLNHVEPGGAHTGIGAEVTDEVAHRIGVGVRVMPFDTVGQMLDALRQGQIDLIPFLTRTPSREKEFAFSRAYVSMPYVLVAHVDAPAYWALDSLRGKRLALPAQHPLMPLLRQRYPDIAIVDVPDGNAAMDAVADKRADAAIEVKLFANLRIHGQGDERLRTVASIEEVPAGFHFAARSGDTALVSLIDRALADIPETDMQRIQRRWIAVDLDPPLPWRRYLPAIGTALAALLLLAGLTAWWVRRLAREVQRRRRSDARLQDIGATLPCVAFRHIVDGDGRLRTSWVSPGAVAILGEMPFTDRTVLAQVADAVPGAAGQALRDQESRSLAQGAPLRATVPYRHPRDGERWLACEAVCTPAEGGQRAWTGYIADVSAEHALQEELVRAAQTRNLLLASASHELRAPAHTLALALQALGTSKVAAAEHGTLRIARDALDTLSQLLGDVLDAARLDGTPLRVAAQPCTIGMLLGAVEEAASITARAREQSFTCSVGRDLPAQIWVDPLRLKQILTNLLSNAFKYTPPGGRITLRAQAGARLDGLQDLCFEVADTGPGIAPELLERLFRPFAAGAPAAPRAASGHAALEGSTGLGLHISRQLAGLMGGALTIDGAPGGGTRAVLTLPLETYDAPPAAATRAGDLLVCDDDVTSRLLLAQVLRTRGFAVQECSDGAQALALCAAGGIAAVVTDLQMPEMDGESLLRQLRAAAGATRPCPVLVLCSGSAEELNAGPGAHPLADATLVKPVDVDALVQVLSRHGVVPQQRPA